jgi:hypothetical protein
VRRALPAGLLAVLATAGCSAESGFVGTATGLPGCAPVQGTVGGGTVLVAQSVRTATWLPCVRQIPVGWTFSGLRAKDGETVITFDSDRDGVHALTILLRPSCDVTGATDVPSEQPEMRRYERVTRVSVGYAGERYYTFTGGCVTYRFDLRGDTRGEPVAAVSESLGFVSRASVARRVHDASDGRLELDD